jgi:hypothetical protein
MIGVFFVALTFCAYLIFTLKDMLIPKYASVDGGTATNATQLAWNETWRNASQSVGNITSGFDQAVNFLVIAVIIAIVAVAIGALLYIKRQ